MRIQNTLFIASLVGATLLVGAMALLMQWSLDRGLLEYANTREAERWQPAADALERYYELNRGWAGMQENSRRFFDVVGAVMDPMGKDRPPQGKNRPPRDKRPPPGGRPPRRDDRPPPGGQFAPGPDVALLAPTAYVLAGVLRPDTSYAELPVNFQGTLVATLAYPRRESLTEGYEITLLEQQREAFLLIGGILLLFALGLSLPLARRLVRPISELATATHKLAQGDYSQQADADRKDELGDLARDFNQLALTLENNDQARKRWLADTSHELRTPIAIVRGELEAMIDGVRPVDEAGIRSAHQEVVHLARLVDDLHELSNADIGGMRYRMADIELNELLADTAQQFETLLAEKQLAFRLSLPPRALVCRGDDTRLAQLLANLLNNSIKYTDSGGEVVLSLARQGDRALVTLADSAPGVPDEALPQLFDHLYRVDSSRNRKTGGIQAYVPLFFGNGQQTGILPAEMISDVNRRN